MQKISSILGIRPIVSMGLSTSFLLSNSNYASNCCVHTQTFTMMVPEFIGFNQLPHDFTEKALLNVVVSPSATTPNAAVRHIILDPNYEAISSYYVGEEKNHRNQV